jgi:hypothetical protein
LFSKDEKIQQKLRNTLIEMTNSKLKRLDRVLLKGFYTHDCRELEKKGIGLREESKTPKKTNLPE